jgi:hypothetical protein
MARRFRHLFSPQAFWSFLLQVTFSIEKCSNGWVSPSLSPWLSTAITSASNTHFGKGTFPLLLNPHVFLSHLTSHHLLNILTGFRVIGEGGSIPFMGMLHQKFPDAQFVITGVLGPNRQGPSFFIVSCFVNASFQQRSWSE